MQNVSEQIEQLKADASNKQITSKARVVAEQLGYASQKNYGSNHVYEQAGFFIGYDDYGNNISIQYQGESVFFLHLGQIERYRPDIKGWIEILDQLYTERAKPKLDAKYRYETDAEAKRLYDTWGIATNHKDKSSEGQ